MVGRIGWFGWLGWWVFGLVGWISGLGGLMCWLLVGGLVVQLAVKQCLVLCFIMETDSPIK